MMNDALTQARQQVERARAGSSGGIAPGVLHATAWRVALRAGLIELLRGVNQVRGAVLALAGNIFGEADRLARDYERLLGALERVDRCPVRTHAEAALMRDALGFAQSMEVTEERTASADDAQEVLAACAVLMNGLPRVARALHAEVQLDAWDSQVSGALHAVLADGDRADEAQVLAALESTRQALATLHGALSPLRASDPPPEMARRRKLRLGKDGDAVALIQRRVAKAAEDAFARC